MRRPTSFGGAKHAIGVAVDVTNEAQVVRASPRPSPHSGKSISLSRTLASRGFLRTPLVDKQIPDQAKKLGISEQEVVKSVMLKETVDGEFTTFDDVAETALFLASFPLSALTGQSVVVSHGWFMQ